MPHRGKELLERIDQGVVIGDGAMGSRLYDLGVDPQDCYDAVNLTHPQIVRQIHGEYLQAGAQLLETNAFSANRLKLAAYHLDSQVVAINRRAVELAREVAGTQAYVAGTIGPLPATVSDTGEDLAEDLARDVFREQMVALAEAGADALILETFSDLRQIEWALREAKKHCDLPVIAQMTFPDGRHAPDGSDALAALETLHRLGADVVGTNCGRGVAMVQRVVEYVGPRIDARLSAYANAGLPEQVGGRYLYLATPEYIADAAERMVKAGVRLIGGCCGTTARDIAAIATRVRWLAVGARPAPRESGPGVESGEQTKVQPAVTAGPAPIVPDFLADLRRKTVILVELDPPKNADLPRLIRGAKLLKDAGADALTLGDSPLATLRMSGLMVAPTIQRETDLPVICHIACRDRNVIGTQSMLLAASALGVHQVLAITGDPAKVGDHPDAANVYDLNSFQLVKLISRLNQGHNHVGRAIGRPTSFCIGVAFNPNVRNLDVEVARLRKKVANGAQFAMTQAVFDATVMRRACAAIKDLGIPVFAGVFPLLSHRHAQFLHNEFPGISIPEAVRQRMADAGPDMDAMAAEGLAIAHELIEEFRACADGLYLIPPLNRAALAAQIIRELRAKV
jgi:homocysteine S-methyltransferase